MSSKIAKALDKKSLPFFTRFLVDEEPPAEPEQTRPTPPPIYTLKFPSDWEDR